MGVCSSVDKTDLVEGKLSSTICQESWVPRSVSLLACPMDGLCVIVWGLMLLASIQPPTKSKLEELHSRSQAVTAIEDPGRPVQGEAR